MKPASKMEKDCIFIYLFIVFFMFSQIHHLDRRSEHTHTHTHDIVLNAEISYIQLQYFSWFNSCFGRSVPYNVGEVSILYPFFTV